MISRRMPLRRLIALVPALIVSSAASCGGAFSHDREGATPPVMVFALERVGDQPLESREQNRHSCSLRPFWGRIILSSDDWAMTDSLFINCPVAGGPGEMHAREGMGRYERARGDTLMFFVADTTLGLNGYVFSGVLRRDELRVIAAAEEEGDYVYRRVRSPSSR